MASSGANHEDQRRAQRILYLIESCQGLTRSIAWKIHQKLPEWVDLEDLIAYGQIGLAQAAERYNSAKGSQFTTYAYYRIRGAILDGLSQMGWFNRQDYHASRYEHMAGDVLLHGHVDVDTDEAYAAWLTGVAVKLAIVYITTADETGPGFVLEGPSEERPDFALQLSEARQKVRELVEELPAQTQRLIQWTYFEGLSLKEAGERLGISRSWASRLHEKALGRLALGLRMHGATLPV